MYTKPWVNSGLKQNGDSTYTLERSDGSKLKFSVDGYLIEKRDRNGQATTLS